MEIFDNNRMHINVFNEDKIYIYIYIYIYINTFVTTKIIQVQKNTKKNSGYYFLLFNTL